MNHKIFFFVLVMFVSCAEDYTPKPRAFFKLEFPEKKYHIIESQCPFSFEIANYSVVVPTKNNCLFDINFPKLNGKLHITYLPLNNNLYQHTVHRPNFDLSSNQIPLAGNWLFHCFTQ